ncbi:acyl carrier protein [Novosphingobium sp.]|jgi:acyl carrier protein|uniref:acyl carrier protein n=1 Tax=Novosphingobium sp. TaxID=1874826 RepID=UPI0031E081A1
MSKDIDLTLRQILGDVLGLKPAQVEALNEDSGLFGHLPELDSMAVAGLLTEIEDRLDIVIEDDEVDGDLLADYGALLRFVKGKVTA